MRKRDKLLCLFLKPRDPDNVGQTKKNILFL